jgi:hypothetical protein
VHDELLPDRRWSIAPGPLLDRLATYVDPPHSEFVLAPRREMAWSNSVAYGPTETGPVARMNPSAQLAAVPEPVIELATQAGAITTAFTPDPAVRDGVVSMTHGHTDANPGNLTSGDDDVDPLTAMPRVAGLEVRVARPDTRDQTR